MERIRVDRAEKGRTERTGRTVTEGVQQLHQDLRGALGHLQGKGKRIGGSDARK